MRHDVEWVNKNRQFYILFKMIFHVTIILIRSIKSNVQKHVISSAKKRRLRLCSDMCERRMWIVMEGRKKGKKKADSGNQCSGIYVGVRRFLPGFRAIAHSREQPGGLYICWVWLQA